MQSHVVIDFYFDPSYNPFQQLPTVVNLLQTALGYMSHQPFKNTKKMLLRRKYWSVVYIVISYNFYNNIATMVGNLTWLKGILVWISVGQIQVEVALFLELGT